jgi:hypothetical protein
MSARKSNSPRSALKIASWLAAGLVAAVGPLVAVPCTSPPSPQGAWTQQGGEAQFLFEPKGVVIRQDGELRAATILSRDACKLIVRDQGLRSTWTLTGDKRALQLDQGKGALALMPLPKVPSSLDIKPFPLPPVQAVAPETVKEVTLELVARERRDQEALKAKPEQRDKQRAVQAENDRYLRELVTRYGWIDIPRFGKPAAAAAIVVVKHAEDVPLMLAALPIVERDARENGGGKELVSILVDETLITTGHKQKYGTQIMEDGNGKPFVVPVEDLGKVEENRKALGILPWADYLKRASDALYQGAAIRIPGPEE